MRLPFGFLIFVCLLVVSSSPGYAIDFSDILGTKSKELERIYKSQMPRSVGESITTSNTTSQTSQTVQSQAESQSDTSAGAAGGYVINRGIKTPTLENTPVTTDVGSFFASLLTQFGNIFGIGSREAKNYADTHYPPGVGETAVGNQQTQRFESPSKISQTTQSEKVLGIFGQDESMGRSLEVVKCGSLPADLCQGNLQNGSPLNAPIAPPDGSGSVSYTDIPYYKTDSEKAGIIDALVPSFLAKMESQILLTFKKTYPTSLIDSYKTVVDQSYKNGFDNSDALHMWNPIFVLAIWIEETHASDACGLGKPIWDFGVILLPRTTCNDPYQIPKFNDQLSRFLEIITKVNPPKTIDQFLCRFSEGKEIGQSETCTFTINPQFPVNLAKVYYCLLKGTYPNDCDSGGGDGGNVDFLVSAISKNCKEQIEDSDGRTYIADGIVSVRNISCLDSLNTDASAPFSDAILAELKSFIEKKFEYLQCVGFVRAAFLLSQGVVLPEITSAINFSQLTNTSGVRFVSKDSGGPSIGDVVIFDTMVSDESSGFVPSPNGHVGIVIKTGGSIAGSFQIAEANWGPGGKVRSDRIIPISHPQLVGWLHKI